MSLSSGFFIFKKGGLYANWCENTLRVTGNKEDLKRFIEVSKSEEAEQVGAILCCEVSAGGV